MSVSSIAQPEGAQLQSEARAYLLYCGGDRALTFLEFRLAFLKNVSMKPKENKIALIVESRDPAAFEVRRLGEEARQHAAHSDPEACNKAIEDELAGVICHAAGALDLPGHYEVHNGEVRCGPLWEVTDDDVSNCVSIVVYEDEICVISVDGVLRHFFKSVIPSGDKNCIGKNVCH